jgi:hypothetical protein
VTTELDFPLWVNTLLSVYYRAITEQIQQHYPERQELQLTTILLAPSSLDTQEELEIGKRRYQLLITNELHIHSHIHIHAIASTDNSIVS